MWKFKVMESLQFQGNTFHMFFLFPWPIVVVAFVLLLWSKVCLWNEILGLCSAPRCISGPGADFPRKKLPNSCLLVGINSMTGAVPVIMVWESWLPNVFKLCSEKKEYTTEFQSLVEWKRTRSGFERQKKMKLQQVNKSLCLLRDKITASWEMWH